MDTGLWSGKPTVLSFPRLFEGIAIAVMASCALGLVIRTVFFWIPLLGLAVATLIIGSTLKRAHLTTYVISTFGVCKTQRHLTYRIEAIPFNKIANITITRGVFGRLFHFGTLTINSTSVSFNRLVITGVSNPEKLRRLIFAAKANIP
ncbi:MAG: PH domain-containing protein [Nitrososphaerota archaeon]|nr:PH domain-containing protein [Nitrososphaerota archaeon]